MGKSEEQAKGIVWATTIAGGGIGGPRVSIVPLGGWNTRSAGVVRINKPALVQFRLVQASWRTNAYVGYDADNNKLLVFINDPACGYNKARTNYSVTGGSQYTFSKTGDSGARTVRINPDLWASFVRDKRKSGNLFSWTSVTRYKNGSLITISL